MKFIFSKLFLKQLGLALVVVLVICFFILKWLNITTNHGEFELVPNLKGKSLSVAEMELKEKKLVMIIQDSANFNPNFPKYSIIEQEPVSGSKVKDNRKIYLTINPSGYRKIIVPNVVDKTYRQARPTLEALGFNVGKIIYKDNIAKDLVLQMLYNGKPLNPSEELPKTSTIDLVLGNGNRP